MLLHSWTFQPQKMYTAANEKRKKNAETREWMSLWSSKEHITCLCVRGVRHWTIKALENCWLCRGPYRTAYYGKGCGRVWPHNSVPLPHGMWRTLWNMRGEGCLIAVFNMMVFDSFPLLYGCYKWEGKRKGRRASENPIGITLKWWCNV